MSSASANLYKQIVLYILHKSRVSLAQNIVINVVVELGYTDYINTQSAIGELVRAGLIRELNTYHRSYISLTEDGGKTISAFIEHLSPDIRREIDDYLSKNHIETIDETALISDYTRTSTGNYTATCSIRDGKNTIFSVSLELPSEEDAIHVCNKWESESEEIYAETLRKLM